MNSNDSDELILQQRKIAKWLKQVRFKKRLFGVDEADVWKKIEELDKMYQTALQSERERYNLLMQERIDSLSREIYNRLSTGQGLEGLYDEE